MQKWNKDYEELLAPYYERVKAIIENGPSAGSAEEKEFVDAIRENKPARPLQYAWLALHSLPDGTREAIVKAFGKGNRQHKLQLSRMAFVRLEEKIASFDRIDDYYREMLDQGITPPEHRAVEPLGTREQHLMERAKGKYNGR